MLLSKTTPAAPLPGRYPVQRGSSVARDGNRQRVSGIGLVAPNCLLVAVPPNPATGATLGIARHGVDDVLVYNGLIIPFATVPAWLLQCCPVRGREA